MDTAQPLPMELVLKHDSRSIIGQLTLSAQTDSHRFSYMVEGEPSPRHIALPKKLFRADLVKGIQTIVTVTITQCGMLPQVPEGLNGHMLGEG